MNQIINMLIIKVIFFIYKFYIYFFIYIMCRQRSWYIEIVLDMMKGFFWFFCVGIKYFVKGIVMKKIKVVG